MKKTRLQNVTICSPSENGQNALFLWMADDQDAVFVLLAEGKETSRVAFRTRDTKLHYQLDINF